MKKKKIAYYKDVPEGVIKQAIQYVVDMQLPQERIVSAIYNQIVSDINQPPLFRVKKKIFLPFLLEFDIEDDNETITLSISRCLQDGRKASEWIKNEILKAGEKFI